MPKQPDLDDRGLPRGYALDEQLELTPRQIKAQLASDAPPRLIDCRTPAEAEITRIDGAELLPLQELPRLFAERFAGRESEPVIVHCHHGGRSMRFVHMLRQAGFTDARSMAGGIAVWNHDVDPGGPQY